MTDYQFSTAHLLRSLRQAEMTGGGYEQIIRDSIFNTTTTANAVGVQKIGDTMGNNKLRDYEVVFADGSVQHLERVDSVTTDAAYTAFWRTEADGTRERVHTFQSDAVFSFRPLPPSEEAIRPKYTFEVKVNGGGATRTVQADLYKVSTYGDNPQLQVTEFYTRIPSGGSRSELSVPTSSVQSVRRIDDLDADAADTKIVPNKTAN